MITCGLDHSCTVESRIIALSLCARRFQEDTSVQLFWESSFLMAVEFYLAFQVMPRDLKILPTANHGQEKTFSKLERVEDPVGMCTKLSFEVL